MSDRRIAPESAIDQFLDAIADKGITPPNRIEADGKIHRFSSSGRPDDDAGWYVFHNNAIPTGSFGDFRTGQAVGVWVANLGRPITPAETAEVRKQQTEANNERAAKDRQLQAEARSKAYRIMLNALPAPDDHPYLVKKDVDSYGLSVWDDANVSIGHSRKDNKPILQIAAQDGSVQIGFKVKLGDKTEEEFLRPWRNILIVPMMDDKGTVQSLQFVSENGDKKFLYGGKMQGSYFTLGDLKDSETILIAEGYATAATIHEITGHPVVVAYNAGNLLEVSQIIRAQKPDAEITLCSDDDWKTRIVRRDGTVLENPGLTSATEAAEAIGGKVLLPKFGPDRPDNATDFNDMAALAGKDAVTAFFTKHSLGRNENMTYTEYNNDNNKAFASFSRPGTAPQASPETPPKTGRIFTGTITNFGPAPYKHDPKNSPSYFITLGSGEDARTVWGVDLGKALTESRFKIGDKVALYDKGRVPVQITTDARDANGNIIGKETKTATKNSWHIGSYEEYVESRKQMAREMAYGDPEDEPDAGRPQREAAAAAKHPAAPRNTYQPEPVREPAPEPKVHFSNDDFSTIQQIWKDVPRQAARHSEGGYDILLDNKSKVRVTKNRIEMAKKPRQRPDEAYIAACEHARHFWNGEMEVQGDIQHRMKAYAYATAYGVKVTNYTPNDRELIEVNRIIESLHKEAEPGFRRPASQRPRQPTARLDV